MITRLLDRLLPLPVLIRIIDSRVTFWIMVVLLSAAGTVIVFAPEVLWP
jgi:hypothetical protein